MLLVSCSLRLSDKSIIESFDFKESYKCFYSLLEPQESLLLNCRIELYFKDYKIGDSLNKYFKQPSCSLIKCVSK